MKRKKQSFENGAQHGSVSTQPLALRPSSLVFGDAAGDGGQPDSSSGYGKSSLIPRCETLQGKVPVGTSTTGFV